MSRSRCAQLANKGTEIWGISPATPLQWLQAQGGRGRTRAAEQGSRVRVGLGCYPWGCPWQTLAHLPLTYHSLTTDGQQS